MRYFKCHLHFLRLDLYTILINSTIIGFFICVMTAIDAQQFQEMLFIGAVHVCFRKIAIFSSFFLTLEVDLEAF